MVQLQRLLQKNTLKKTIKGGSQMSQNVINVTDSSFDQEIVKSDLPVLVDFWAAWCGPCKMIAPVIEQIAIDYEGIMKVAKVDVDKNQSSASKYGVMSIPTMLLFKNGEPINRFVGFMPKERLKSLIDKELV
jgi:thioredoxin 1